MFENSLYCEYGQSPLLFLVYFLGSLTGTITHAVVRNLVTMWLQFVVMIITWKFS